MSEIKIQFDPSKLKLVDPKSLKIDPKNSNKHPPEQIDRMVKLYETFGMRWPILVSERTGVIKAGEARLLAALKLNMPQVLVTYQPFEDEVEEYAFGVSDNAIASWSILDLSQIHIDIGEFGPFDLDILGVKSFDLAPINVDTSQNESEKVDLNPQWIVAVQCAGEHEMQEIFDEMTRRGLTCKLIT